ncbi:hypothetical protein B7463_g9994, partial [Scytalidium lignicola]
MTLSWEEDTKAIEEAECLKKWPEGLKKQPWRDILAYAKEWKQPTAFKTKMATESQGQVRLLLELDAKTR